MMTNDEIRIEIAESIGWQWWEFRDCERVMFCMLCEPKRNGSNNWQERQGGVKCERPMAVAETLKDFSSVPKYTEDLNAMHEVEMGLKGSKEDEYCEMADYQEHLCLICGDGVEPPNVYNIDLIRATARQRAESYLRTIGKWRDA